VAGVPVTVVAGRVELDGGPDGAPGGGLPAAAVSLTELAGSAQAAMDDPAHWLAVAASRLADAASGTGAASS
jgi:glycerate kinase